MKEELKMDKLLREKLDGFSSAPPPGVWEGVKGQMAAMKSKKRVLYVRWISAAAVLVLALMAGWYFTQPTNKITPNVVENSIEKQKSDELKNQTTDNSKESKMLVESKSKGLKEIDNQVDNKKVQELKTINNYNFNEEEVKLEDVVTDINRIERFSLAMLDKFEALFEFDNAENKLKEIRQKNTNLFLSEIENNRIAENANRYGKLSNKEAAWKMGMHLSPGYSSHQASHNDVYAQNMTYSGQEGTGNVGGGFSVQYKTTKRFSIESGIYYAQNGQKSRNSELFAFNSLAGIQVDASEKSYFNTAVNVSAGKLAMNSTAGVIEFSGVPDRTVVAGDLDGTNNRTDGLYAPAAEADFSNTLLTSGEFSQVFDFIEIPLYVRYSLIDAKFDIEVMGGINAGLIVGNNAFMDDGLGAQNIGKTQDISQVNLSGTVGVGLTYALGKHLSMAVEPRFNYYLNSINNNPDVDFRPYRVGVFTGVYYEF